jgi:hypothetical protein
MRRIWNPNINEENFESEYQWGGMVDPNVNEENVESEY